MVSVYIEDGDIILSQLLSLCVCGFISLCSNTQLLMLQNADH